MDEEQDIYEALPPTTTVSQHMAAGAAAGITEHCIMYPVDCVKTRMQALIPNPKADYRNVPDAFKQIVRHEGITNTFRGMTVVIGGAGPAHALYFACYEKIKNTLTNGKRGNHLAHGAAGATATLLHDAVMNPTDVIKQRMQIYGSPYKTCLHCMRTVYKQEGFRAFYRSYTTQLTMNIPFQCVHFMTYEVMQDMLNHDRQYSPLSHVVSGGMAGAMAATVTMPLDVCKTLLNTQECCAERQVTCVNGMVSAIKTVYRFQGFFGFFRGLQARMMLQTPATAISWTVYELFKFMLSRKDSVEESYINTVTTVRGLSAISQPEPQPASPSPSSSVP